MNSEKLKNKLNDYYKDFFSRNALVLSIPTSLTLFGWTACIFGGLIMKQKISQRLYLWINLNWENKINIKSHDYYDYKKWQICSNLNENYLKIGEEFKNLVYSDYKVWINVEIFSEFEWKDSDLIVAWIILSLDLITKKINSDKIEFIKSSTYEEILNDEYYKSFIQKALHYRLLYNENVLGWSSLSSIITGLVDWKAPILNMISKRIESPLTKFSSWKNKLLADINNHHVEYNAFRINELIDEDSWQNLPYDFMIFSIDEYRNDNWFQSTINRIEDSIQFKEVFKNKCEDNHQEFFLKSIDKNEIIYNNLETIVNYEFALLKTFCDSLLYKSKIDKLFYFMERNNELIKSLLGKQNIISNSIEKENYFKLTNLINELYSNIWKDQLLIYTTSQSNDNKYIVMLPKELNSIDTKTIDNLISKYFWNRWWLIYSSKNHWIEDKWIIIEQDIYNWKISNYTNWLYYLKNLDWSRKIWDYEYLMKNYEWILLDTITQKIFINGRKINSKELLSQTSTIEIFKLLTENVWSEISNKQLPISAYSKNRNELVWKIIIPLQNLVKKELNENMELVCKWSLTSFTVLLKSIDFPIWILGKY